MDAGRLDRRIELRRQVLTLDESTGQTVESWPTAYATVWAEKADLRGREFFAANQVNSEITTLFRIRHRTDVLATDRIVCDGLSYNINPPAEIGRRDGLEIMATAVRP
jgi:SPP1 family predicted phage head-tail adaptor